MVLVRGEKDRATKMLLNIEKLVYGGEGLARVAGPDGRNKAVFVPFVLPGEQVEAQLEAEKPGFARAAVTRLLKPSPERITAACPYFGGCGGCHYQHISYERQLEYKAQILRETLGRIAKVELETDIQLHASPPWQYRNRTRLQVRTVPEFTLAYHRFGSRQLIAIRECPISSPLINRTIARLLEQRGCQCPDSVREVEFFVDSRDEHLLAWCFCERGGEINLFREWAARLAAEMPELAGMAFLAERAPDGDDSAKSVIFAHSGKQELLYEAAGATYRVSAGAFFQVNRHLIDELVMTVSSGVSGQIAIDLYAGVGLFSVALARSFHHIFAVEASQISSADLRHNAPANVKAVCARSEDYLSRIPARQRPDLLVVDPPRAGLGKGTITSLVNLAPSRLRYVSCDPATLARDLAPLLAAGYRIEEAHLFDLFPETFHIESVMLLAR